jgi:hypothetical protein
MLSTVWYTQVNLDHANRSTTQPCPARLACVYFPMGTYYLALRRARKPSDTSALPGFVRFFS